MQIQRPSQASHQFSHPRIQIQWSRIESTQKASTHAAPCRQIHQSESNTWSELQNPCPISRSRIKNPKPKPNPRRINPRKKELNPNPRIAVKPNPQLWSIHTAESKYTQPNQQEPNPKTWSVHAAEYLPSPVFWCPEWSTYLNLPPLPSERVLLLSGTGLVKAHGWNKQ